MLTRLPHTTHSVRRCCKRSLRPAPRTVVHRDPDRPGHVHPHMPDLGITNWVARRYY